MKYLVILLCFLVVGGWCLGRRIAADDFIVIQKDFIIEDNTTLEPQHLVTFFEGKDEMWIDFDYKNNKWIYSGDLDKMMKGAIDYPYFGECIVMIEIIRQLKEGVIK